MIVFDNGSERDRGVNTLLIEALSKPSRTILPAERKPSWATELIEGKALTAGSVEQVYVRRAA